MIYAVIITDVILISGIVFLAFRFYKKRKMKKETIKRRKPDMEIFRGCPEKLERSIKEWSQTGKAAFSSGVYRSHVSRRCNSAQKHTDIDNNKKEKIVPDLAEQTARSFEHGGLNMNNNLTSYFNL